ncbi:MAG TPA: adenylate/guanylate cyclase domain-containing protein [Ktedonobacteraceae bacterium]|nr:adenylate/guanylate cyclase domain-containing protein [Ktedonobacteraceae bacterium]
MSWNKERSLDRIQKDLDGMGEIEVKKLTREADLEQLLSEKICRLIYGAHVYIQISNFTHLASDSIYAKENYKRLIQGIHIYQREVTHIVEGLGGTLIHFQGSKLHALFYRPIDNAKKLATRAVLLQLVLKDFVQTVFNPAFPDYNDFTIAGGADLGNAIGTMDGINGDRELLFLGAPANHAAKIISSAHRLRLTHEVYEALPDDLKGFCFKSDDGPFQLKPIRCDDLDALLATHGLSWNRDASAKNIENDKKRFPLKDIGYSSAEAPIDLDELSISNNKRALGASIFADVSGFTSYIDAATSEADKQAVLRVFHAIRKETARVITGDFDGLRIQYQGDRIQGLFHLPQDDESAIVKKVVEAAAGLQSSMECTLKSCLPEASGLHLAIGIDLGITLVSKLGARGQRDRICLGGAVEGAAQLEERSEGGQIAVSSRVHSLLPEYICGRFQYNSRAQGYIATNLTTEQIERAARAAEVYGVGAPVFVHTSSTGVRVNSQESAHARTVVPARPYADEA